MNTTITFCKLQVKRLLLLFTGLCFVSIVNAQNPVITLNGADTIKIQVNSSYTEPGVTAIDKNNANITNLVQTTGVVNTSILGTYILVYSVNDAYGNSANTKRVVIVGDFIPCMLHTQAGTDTMIIKVNDFNFTEPTVTGTDNYFSTIQITRNNGGFDITKKGVYTITYTGKDGAGNTCSYTRTIIVAGSGQKPQIICAPVNITQNTIFDPFKNVSTWDSYYPPSDFMNSTNGCRLDVISSNVNPSVPGTYQVCYQATNGDGVQSVISCCFVNIHPSSTTGIAKTAPTAFELYPNPASSHIQVKTNGVGYFTIYDISGKTLISQAIDGTETAVDISALAPGIYVVSLLADEGGNSLATKKLVIK